MNIIVKNNYGNWVNIVDPNEYLDVYFYLTMTPANEIIVNGNKLTRIISSPVCTFKCDTKRMQWVCKTPLTLDYSVGMNDFYYRFSIEELPRCPPIPSHLYEFYNLVNS